MPWGSLRAKVEPSFAERSTIDHKDYLHHGRIIVSSATDITETEVLTSDGQHVEYDYLVIATGRAETFPRSRAERLHQYYAGNAICKPSRGMGNWNSNCRKIM